MSFGLARRGASARRGGDNIADDVFDAALSPGSTVYLQRTDADSYQFYAQAGRGKYIEWNLEAPGSLPGSYTPSPHFLTEVYTRYPMLAINYSDGTWSYTGAGWTIGGGQRRTATTDDYAEWTTPSGTIAIQFEATKAANCGFALVAIGGDKTAANRLPTAQDYVDDGLLASTALVANGGTLNPTDRLWECYPASSGAKYDIVADGLSPAAHTVRVTCTGYKRAAASDTRILVRNARYATASITPATASVIWVEEKRLMTAESAWEFAYRFDVSGEEWTGSVHGYEEETSFDIEVDGTPDTLGDGEVVSGSTITIDRVTELYHPNVGSGATVVGDCDLTYTFSQSGLQVAHSTEWNTTMTPTIAYPAMMPVSQLSTNNLYEAMDLCSGSDVSVDFTLDDDDGSKNLLGESETVWGWSAGGQNFAVCRIADISAALNSFTDSDTDKVFFEDRTGAGVKLNKMYFTRVSSSATGVDDVEATDVWASDVTYRWGAVSDADSLCSRGT